MCCTRKAPFREHHVLMASIFLLLGNAIFVLQLGRLVGERTLRDIVLGRYHRSARRSASSCSSTSPARRRSPSGSVPTRSIAFSVKSSGLPRIRSTIIEARSINTSATRS